MGSEEGDGVEFLERATRKKVGFRGASEKEKREGVDVRISNLSTSLSLVKAPDMQTLTPAMPCSTPGPPTTRQTPGLPVRYP